MGKYFSSHNKQSGDAIHAIKCLYGYQVLKWKQTCALLSLCDQIADDISNIHFAELYLKLLSYSRNELAPDVQDQIGRDMAKVLLSSMDGVDNKDMARLRIIKESRLYKFFIQDPFESSEESVDFGLTRTSKGKHIDQMMLPYEAEELLVSKVIDQEQYDNLLSMINSIIDSDRQLAADVIEGLRAQRLKT